LHRGDDIELDFRQVEGRVKDAILEELDSGPYDLCVMGSHGRRGLRRFVFGSTSEMTVRYAQCPVIVARPRPEPPPQQEIVL
jgi:nucleotide-binding universal stress UspA family protein